MIILLYTLLALVILLIIGLICEEFLSFIEDKNLNPPGDIIKLDTGNTHMFSKGNGNNTVVFTSGSGVTSPYCDYYKLQENVSKFSKTALFERYGYGFSDNVEYDANIDAIVENLRQSLKASGHTPPYVIVAHSMAGLEALRFAQLYPNEVKGIVMIDALNPWFIEHKKKTSIISIRFLQILKYTGILRLLTLTPYFKNKLQINNITDEVNRIKKALFIRNFWNEDMITELKSLSSNCTKVLDKSQSIGDIPLIILTAENEKNFSKEEKDAWINTQKDLITWSSRSKQVLVKGADHFIHHTNQDVVLIAIKEILED